MNNPEPKKDPKKSRPAKGSQEAKDKMASVRAAKKTKM